ncbi:hypothetical protein MtrunA17_Chr4g0071351 [Medicago truncatula]|uniref:Uncharacterized protein n=1 Tax=Medicago truncatula TaxID=3880 RepID=A0A396IGB6_MEDTR|nr:hypothetical protein MtrunA17_Chr4g0071351 [Medicago truncatula]
MDLFFFDSLIRLYTRSYHSLHIPNLSPTLYLLFLSFFVPVC